MGNLITRKEKKSFTFKVLIKFNDNNIYFQIISSRDTFRSTVCGHIIVRRYFLVTHAGFLDKDKKPRCKMQRHRGKIGRVGLFPSEIDYFLSKYS